MPLGGHIRLCKGAYSEPPEVALTPAALRREQDGDLAAFNQTLLVQVGEGNRFEPTQMGGVVIQNTLDNQDIRVSTRIDTQVGTLGVFQAIQQQDALQGALAGAVLP